VEVVADITDHFHTLPIPKNMGSLEYSYKKDAWRHA